MSVFWIAAAILAGGAALLVMLFARRAVRGAGGENPALAVHRRQLAEIDDLADRGLLGVGDEAAARAEAGRRLLASAALGATPEGLGSNRSRLIAVAAAAGAAAGAFGLYVVLGAPGVPDQPYTTRVAAWRKSDPASLDPSRMAAVLKTIAADRPGDPEVFSFLGKAEMAAGDPFAAQKAFATAAGLAPDQAGYQTQLGEALLATGGDKLSSDAATAAKAAFARALTLDPHNIPARYALGQTDVLAGNRAGGVAQWRTLLADLPATDGRRALLSQEIVRVAAGGPIDAPPTPPVSAASVGADPSAFIRGMVASLAAKLAANPDDPEGWARLVRSYGVLHDAPAQADALARARKLFAGKPAALQPIEDEANEHPAG